ncbi:PAAR domain-containing protein [Bartonella sp. HY038]|uniref:PAAR domain-containing protein n=1 Tax=Bartonella sp. HY038 TaxID=2759660 RepID=UPI0015F91440|nr:PAAR domain-containing protein [Bartonella sp. HY038]
MPPAHRKGDIGSGHGCHYPPSVANSGSPNVFVNGRPLMRVDDTYTPHACNICPSASHGRKASVGSRSVFVNGKVAVRIGDAIDCGGVAQNGSKNVNIGNKNGTDANTCQYQAKKEASPMQKG